MNQFCMKMTYRREREKEVKRVDELCRQGNQENRMSSLSRSLFSVDFNLEIFQIFFCIHCLDIRTQTTLIFFCQFWIEENFHLVCKDVNHFKNEYKSMKYFFLFTHFTLIQYFLQITSMYKKKKRGEDLMRKHYKWLVCFVFNGTRYKIAID